MDYLGGVKEFVYPRARGAGSCFPGEIALHYLDSEDFGLQNDPDQIELELGRGVMKNPTTAKAALDMEYGEERTGDIAGSPALLDVYTPALRMLKAIEQAVTETV